MESQQLRKFMKMKPEQVMPYSNLTFETGILVNRTDLLSPAYHHLQQFDVISMADGVAIADDGTIEFRNGFSSFLKK